MKQEVERVIHNYFTSLMSMYRLLVEDPIFLLMLLLARPSATWLTRSKKRCN